jgi:hypothetical protein
LTSDFTEESAIADAPSLFCRCTDKKDFTRIVRKAKELMSSDNLLVVCQCRNGMVLVEPITYQIDEEHQFLSDEAVESIVREDYDCMVACPGKATTDDYFREKTSGLEGNETNIDVELRKRLSTTLSNFFNVEIGDNDHHGTKD